MPDGWGPAAVDGATAVSCAAPRSRFLSFEMRLALFGPPGAGKGTQAQRLAARHGLAHLSTGDLFRAAVAAGTPMGRNVDALLKAGQLVPDNVTNGVVEEALADLGDSGFVLDGFPRTVPQAEWLLGHLEATGRQLFAVIRLTVPDAMLVERLSRRRTDPLTGAIYHLDHNPPPADVPDERLVHRKDDHPEAIAERLRVYHDETEPVEATLRARVHMVNVDGTGALDAVTERISEALTRLHGLAGL